MINRSGFRPGKFRNLPSRGGVWRSSQSSKAPIPPSPLKYAEILGLNRVPSHRLTYFIDRPVLMAIRAELCRAFPIWHRLGITHVALWNLPAGERTEKALTDLREPGKRGAARGWLSRAIDRVMRPNRTEVGREIYRAVTWSYVACMEAAQEAGLQVIGLSPPPLRIPFVPSLHSRYIAGQREDTPVETNHGLVRAQRDQPACLDYTIEAYREALASILAVEGTRVGILGTSWHFGYHYTGAQSLTNEIFTRHGFNGQVIQFIGGRATPDHLGTQRGKLEMAAVQGRIDQNHFMMAIPTPQLVREAGADYFIHLPQKEN